MLTFLATTRPAFYKIRPFPLIGVVTEKSVSPADSCYPCVQAYYPHLACPVGVRGRTLCATIGNTVKDSEGINTGPASCSPSRREDPFSTQTKKSQQASLVQEWGKESEWRGEGHPKASSCEESPNKKSRNQFS